MYLQTNKKLSIIIILNTAKETLSATNYQPSTINHVFNLCLEIF